jgi:hypothetical protein
MVKEKTKKWKLIGLIEKIDSAMEDSQDLLDYQSDLMNWETFKFRCLQRHYKFNDNKISTSYPLWLEGQKDNNLSNTSSGSFLTALSDYDNIVSDDEDITKEESDELYSYCKNKINLLK